MKGTNFKKKEIININALFNASHACAISYEHLKDLLVCGMFYFHHLFISVIDLLFASIKSFGSL